MPERVYNMDSQSDFEALKQRIGATSIPQVYPRETIYGTPEALALGLDPVEAEYPNIMLQPDEYVDRMKEAHELRTLPIYYMYKWRPKGFRWNQDGIGYCWTWSGTGWVMTTFMLEGKELPKGLLAPVSMGYLVGWANRGNYLGSFIKGAREDGIAPAVNGDYNSTNRSSRFWNENDGNRYLYKINKVWDTLSSKMVQHCHSILYYGRSLYAAWNSLGHAMEIVAIRYVNGVREWLVSNSHNESDIIIMRGNNATPSEAYGGVSTKIVNLAA